MGPSGCGKSTLLYLFGGLDRASEVFGIMGGLYLGYVFVIATRVIFPLRYYFPLAGILVAIAIGLLFGVLAAFIPARQAVRLNVVEALRFE